MVLFGAVRVYTVSVDIAVIMNSMLAVASD